MSQTAPPLTFDNLNEWSRRTREAANGPSPNASPVTMAPHMMQGLPPGMMFIPPQMGVQGQPNGLNALFAAEASKPQRNPQLILWVTLGIALLFLVICLVYFVLSKTSNKNAKAAKGINPSDVVPANTGDEEDED